MMHFQAHTATVGGIHFLVTLWLRALSSHWLLAPGHPNVLEPTCNFLSHVSFHRLFTTWLLVSSRPAGESFDKSAKWSLTKRNVTRRVTSHPITFSILCWLGERFPPTPEGRWIQGHGSPEGVKIRAKQRKEIVF